MSNVIEFVSRNQLQSAREEPTAMSLDARHSRMQQALQQELQKLVETTNFLESLRTSIKAQVAANRD